MKFFNGYETKKSEKLFLCFVGLFSILIFIYYLQKNMYISLHDEGGYLQISTQILQEGLFSLKEPVRTYMYPLLIAVFRAINFGDDLYSKAIFSVFQYFVYIMTIILIANVSWAVKPKKIIVHTIFSLGVLNPYLIQSATLYLTDLLSSCIIVITIVFAASSNVNKGVNIFLSIGLLVVSLMIRPSNAIFFPVVFIILLIRLIKKEIKLNFKLLVFGFAQLLILLPQLYNNVVHFNKWTPLIVQKLYTTQSIWATQFLKYATLASSENPQLFYNNPYHLFRPDDTTTIFQMMFENFGVFIFTVSAHLFAVLDWGYIDTYITNFYPVSRIFGSVFLYLSWLLILLGICLWVKGFFEGNFKSRMRPGGLAINACLFTSILYTSFISTTLVESRFGYPIFILLLAFSGWGAEYVFNSIKSSNNSFLYFIKALGYLVLFVILVAVLLLLSFKFDVYTGKIDWKTVFPFLP